MQRWRRALWVTGWPARIILLALIRLYRVLLSPVLGGGCRFHPSCSVYAEQAIRGRGAVRGSALAAWRLLRCSPFSRGGVDYPPQRDDHPLVYDDVAPPRYDAVTFIGLKR